MRIHCIIHEKYEGIGCIKEWIRLKGHSASFTLIFNNEPFPEMESFDWLIIMGGGMSVYEENRFPVLKTEKAFIRKTIEEGKTILGICLGSQLLADALGGRVYPGREKEIGWYPVKIDPSKLPAALQSLPSQIMAFHWHGDTYDLPEKAVLFASSEVTPHQGFFFGKNIMAIQFHYEVNENALKMMVDYAGEELKRQGNYIQSATGILGGIKYVEENNQIMFRILDYLESITPLK